MNRSSNQSVFAYSAIFLLYFIISMNLLGSYTGGDQVFYNNFYRLAFQSTLSEAFSISNGTIGSLEPLSIFVLWLGSNLGFSKDVWISFLNAIMASSLLAILRRYRVPWYTIILVFSNFYLIVLMTGAERLKIAYILVFSALSLTGICRITLGTLAVLAHFQMLLLIPSVLLIIYERHLLRFLKHARVSFGSLATLPVVFVALIVVILFFNQILYSKSVSYLTFSTSVSTFSILAFLGLFLFKRKRLFLFAFLPLLLAVVLLGPERINILAFSLFFYFAMRDRVLDKCLCVSLLFYLSIKTIPFLINIYTLGDGFSGPLF